MAEYTIVARENIKDILNILYPYILMKKRLCFLVLDILSDLEKVKTRGEFLDICEKVDKTANLTDSKKRTVTKDTVKKFFDHLPVETCTYDKHITDS